MKQIPYTNGRLDFYAAFRLPSVPKVHDRWFDWAVMNNISANTTGKKFHQNILWQSFVASLQWKKYEIS